MSIVTAPPGDSISAGFVAQIYNAQFDIAQERLNRNDALTSQAISYIDGAPQIDEYDISSELDIPPAPEIEGFTSAELTSLYQGTADEIKALLADGLTNFLTTFFPLGAELAKARAWIERAIDGGTGIAAAVEAQIWERDRARLLMDAMRISEEAMASFAARGYPVPPGALHDQLQRSSQETRNKVAQASRDVAIKQAEIEVENVRFAVEKAIDLRKAAIQAAGDYIRTLALAPQLGVQLATSVVDARTKMAQALTSFYAAKISALELPVRVAIANAGNAVNVRTANQSASVDIIQARVNLMDSAARSVGTQAAAALNALGANTGFSGSESVG
jgi:hypothetical protein